MGSEMKSSNKKCGAKNRQGKPCAKHPMKGKKRCMLHGGKSTGARTAKGLARAAAGPLKHGAYSKIFRKLLTKEDKKAHKEIIEGLESDEFNAADKLMRESIAMLLIRASKMDDPTRLLAEVRGQLKDLKVSRVGREGEKLDITGGIEIKKIKIITGRGKLDSEASWKTRRGMMKANGYPYGLRTQGGQSPHPQSRYLFGKRLSQTLPKT